MRARNIKPGFFKNENLGDLDPTARLLFIGLWCMADRDGRLEDRPKRIKAEVLPYDDVNIEKLMDKLNKANFIIRYEEETGGNKYIEIPNFTKHQNPHKNEKTSEIPPLEKCRVITGAVPEKHSTNRADSLIPDSLIPDCLTSSERSSEPSEPPVIEIILNTKEMHPITQYDLEDWEKLFPAVDVIGELRKMAAWAQANPQRRKTDRGIRRFIVSWLSKEQDRGKVAEHRPTNYPISKQGAAHLAMEEIERRFREKADMQRELDRAGGDGGAEEAWGAGVTLLPTGGEPEDYP